MNVYSRLAMGVLKLERNALTSRCWIVKISKMIRIFFKSRGNFKILNITNQLLSSLRSWACFLCIVIFIHYQNHNCYAFAVIAIINSLSNIPCLLLLILLLLRLISTVMSVLIIKFYPGQRRQLQTSELTGWPYGTSVLAASSVPDSKTYYDISRGPLSTCSLYCEAKVDPFTKIMLPAVVEIEILNVCACVCVCLSISMPTCMGTKRVCLSIPGVCMCVRVSLHMLESC